MEKDIHVLPARGVERFYFLRNDSAERLCVCGSLRKDGYLDALAARRILSCALKGSCRRRGVAGAGSSFASPEGARADGG